MEGIGEYLCKGSGRVNEVENKSSINVNISKVSDNIHEYVKMKSMIL